MLPGVDRRSLKHDRALFVSNKVAGCDNDRAFLKCIRKVVPRTAEKKTAKADVSFSYSAIVTKCDLADAGGAVADAVRDTGKDIGTGAKKTVGRIRGLFQ